MAQCNVNGCDFTFEHHHCGVCVEPRDGFYVRCPCDLAAFAKIFVEGYLNEDDCATALSPCTCNDDDQVGLSRVSCPGCGGEDAEVLMYERGRYTYLAFCKSSIESEIAFYPLCYLFCRSCDTKISDRVVPVFVSSERGKALVRLQFPFPATLLIQSVIGPLVYEKGKLVPGQRVDNVTKFETKRCSVINLCKADRAVPITVRNFVTKFDPNYRDALGDVSFERMPPLLEAGAGCMSFVESWLKSLAGFISPSKSV